MDDPSEETLEQRLVDKPAIGPISHLPPVFTWSVPRSETFRIPQDPLTIIRMEPATHRPGSLKNKVLEKAAELFYVLTDPESAEIFGGFAE